MVLLLFSSLLFGFAGALFIAKFGHRFGIIDYPSQRSSHAYPVPKGGGVGLLLTFTLISLATKIPIAFWIPIAFVSFVSLFVDRFDLKPHFRLFVHFSAALSLLLLSRLPPDSPISFLALCFFMLFIAGTANFYNFMDGINGIAGITGTIAFGFLAYFAAHAAQNPHLSSLALCLSLACLGFLPLNLKSRVFMGDVGSILLGFSFAAMTVFLSGNFLDFITLAAFLFPFYADEILTMIGRIKNREKLTQAHRKHIYQILANEYGIAHWKIALLYGMIQVVISAGVLQIKPYGIFPVGLFLIGCFACAVVFNAVLRNKIKDAGHV